MADAPALPSPDIPVPKRSLATTPQPPSADEASDHTPASRKARRLAKHQKASSPAPSVSSNNDDTAITSAPKAKSKPPNNPPKPKPVPTQTSTSNPAEPTQMPPAPLRIPLLVASLGNPGPKYAQTLHSAGHVVLEAVRDILRFGEWTPNKHLGGGLTAKPAEYRSFGIFQGFKSEQAEDMTLWQSTSVMNVSGASLKVAYARWLASLPTPPADALAKQGQNPKGILVVLHDELELPFGEIKLRKSGTSTKGHNGLKSVEKALQGHKWLKIGIGIGRPQSREPEVVSRYVLGKMSKGQLEQVEGCSDGVIRLLRSIEEGDVRV